MNQDQKLRAFTWALIDALEDVRAQPASESDWRDLNQADVNLRRELEAIDALTATQQAAPSQGAGSGYVLAMAVLQSDLYLKLDDQARAQCDAMLSAIPQPAAQDISAIFKEQAS